MAAHHDHQRSTSTRMILTVMLNLLITAVEVVGGIASGSLSLLSDALHNLSDALAVLLSYGAMRLASRANTVRHTFGLKRAEILAALITSGMLLGLSVYLMYRAAVRFVHPELVQGRLMMAVAAVGLVANVTATLLLRRGARESMNVRSAYLHLLSDAVSSIAVVVGGLAITLLRVSWVDPLLTILISAYLSWQSFLLVRGDLHVLMEGAPAGMELSQLKRDVESLPGVHGLHQVHLWSVGEHDVHFEAHVHVQDMSLSEAAEVRTRIERLLRQRFGIHHTALQLECDQCGETDLLGNPHPGSADRV